MYAKFISASKQSKSLCANSKYEGCFGLSDAASPTGDSLAFFSPFFDSVGDSEEKITVAREYDTEKNTVIEEYDNKKIP